MRSALVGMRVAESLELSPSERSDLFYAVLLKDLGCSSNAAKMTYLFGADDHLLKRETKTIDWSKASAKFKFVWNQCAPGGSTLEKLLRLAAIARSGPSGEKKIVEIRCERGAEIARRLKFNEATAQAIRSLDEHWDGQGHPSGLRGEEIPLLARICCLAQTVEVFFTTYGLEAAIDVAEQRRGKWFDPQLVDALVGFKNEARFWSRLHAADLPVELGRWEPQDAVMLADQASIDRIAAAFADVVDAKSPWTFQHSTRVANVAVDMAEKFGCSREVVRDIRRAGLLHDLGKLGVSNLILDKPGKPTDEEFAQIRRHPDFTKQILEQVAAFQTLADVAAGHHERLDGRGYHRRLTANTLPWVSQLLAVADIYEALSAQRPYRDALPWTKVHTIMSRETGTGIDADCFAALEQVHERHDVIERTERQLQAVDRLLTEIA